MKFNFDEMKDLAKSDPEVFEQRRKELLNAAILDAPEHLQTSLSDLQRRLDLQRERDPIHFLSFCFSEIRENLENLQDQWRAMSVRVAEMAGELGCTEEVQPKLQVMVPGDLSDFPWARKP